MNDDFEPDLEHELRASRPAPRGELLDGLVTKIHARPAPARRSAWQLRIATVLSLAALVGLAGLGGVSAASSAFSHGGGHAQGSNGKHGGKSKPEGKKDVGVCLNGSTKVLYFEKKKAIKLVEIKHRGVYAPCPAP